MTQRENKHDPHPKTPDSPTRDPQPTPGPSYSPTSVGQSQKSQKSEVGKSKPNSSTDSCGCDDDQD